MTAQQVHRVLAAVLAAMALAAAGTGTYLYASGYRLYAVRTGSMIPTFPIGSLIVDAPVEQSQLTTGEAITFQTLNGPVTHRIHEVRPAGYSTKGDANDAPDPWIVPLRHVTGHVVAEIDAAGYVLVFLRSPTSILGLVLLLVGLLLFRSMMLDDTAAPARPDAVPA